MSTQFMKATKITNVNLATNHLLMQHTWKKHMKAVHECQTNYKCDSCGKSFTATQYLKRHIQIVHKRAQTLQM